ncbi:Sterol uptake control protein 2 [Tolypocladium capitatum]|uniref:Sterol uptake control protein 2 n=1 Tax=Tolypocladium capitatum TaxID=45235 RepID=A0A2K3QHG0_9HYPO|nr:Sterol uptake control protein 2 [Tolypocladium capitatum]
MARFTAILTAAPQRHGHRRKITTRDGCPATTSLRFGVLVRSKPASSHSAFATPAHNRLASLLDSAITMDMQPFSAGMLSYPEPPEFDYSSFLQSGDTPLHDASNGAHSAAALSEDSSGKSTPPSSDHRSTTSGPNHAVCQETRPACGHCVKTGLKCEYPSVPQITHQPHHEIPLFSLQDMRFFQHFLTQCYPHHPLKQEDIWTHEIPCIAHNHDFLMHAILGFAASELTHTDSSLVTAAMNHRIKAIRAIKKRLTEGSRVETTYEEANALVATCFALTFQSVSLDDGLAEYMTFIRGILIIGMQMMFKGIKPVFQTLFEDRQNELVAPLMQDLPLIQRAWADAAVEAISNLRPLCVDAVEVEYYEQLLGIAEKLYTSSFDAYKANSREYGWWMMLPHASFQELINLNRQVIILLHTHWIALAQIMSFITEREYDLREKQPAQEDSSMDPGFIRWLKYLNARVDYEHQMYNQWPMWVDEQLDRDMTFFGRRRWASWTGSLRRRQEHHPSASSHDLEPDNANTDYSKGSTTMTGVQAHVETKNSLHFRPSSRRSSLPPEYDDADAEYVELGGLAPSANTSAESLPQYGAIVTGPEALSSSPSSSSAAAATAGLRATHIFQIKTHGHPLIALPVPPKPLPIRVYSVLSTGEVGPLAYESLRETCRSGNCVLVRAGDNSAASALCSTTYRFGPYRPPKVQLMGEVACEEDFEVVSKGCHTRAQNIRTRLGTFQWRYAGRAERKAIGANSLVVLDVITTVALAGGKQEERRRRVAQLVRNEKFRTEGTRCSTAGNGGRLMMDLMDWADTKGEVKQMEVFVIASCITMLKKEVDRRRMQQMVVIAAGASGGS